MRRILGDGNCYYRALIFSVLEQIVQSGDRSSNFKQLHRIFSEVTFGEYSEENIMHNHLLKSLLDASYGRCLQSPEDIEREMLKQKRKFVFDLDTALIIACRCLVQKYLIENQFKQLKNGLTIAETILPSHEDCR